MRFAVLSMFPCFYYDSASQRTSLCSAENTHKSFPRVRDGWLAPLMQNAGDDLGTKVLSSALLPFFPSFPAMLRVKPWAFCMLNQSFSSEPTWYNPHPTLTLYFPPVVASAIFSKCRSGTLRTLSATQEGFSSHRELVFDSLSTYLSAFHVFCFQVSLLL